MKLARMYFGKTRGSLALRQRRRRVFRNIFSGKLIDAVLRSLKGRA